MNLTRTLLILSLGICLSATAQNDIENVIVEKYYISNGSDATDTVGGGLVEGSTTYRVYLQLCDSCALRTLYGDENHALRISSTAVFFNNRDRGETFGHEIANNRLDENTVALDSWLSMGGASNQMFGILKTDDTDGSIIGGANNDGGSEVIAGGLLVNANPDAGIPLIDQDGLVPQGSGSVVPPGFSHTGTQPSTVFNDSTLYNEFLSYDTRIGTITPGVFGPTDDNRILVAQLTTAGDLSFELNIEVERADGTLQKYVANDTALQVDETANGLLVYPPQCGCTDPNFLEYDPNAGCDDGSCATTIIFGCLDTTACNYDPGANFNIAQLCCYGPDSCNGLNVAFLCPDVSLQELRGADAIVVYPNPATTALHIQGLGQWTNASEVRFVICDALGRVLSERRSSFGYEVDIPVNDLANGGYLLRIISDDGVVTRPFIRQ